MRSFLTYWLPPIAWTAAILSASTDTFSSLHTMSWLEQILRAILGHPIAPPALDTLNLIVRKCAHLTEYGILSILLFRALRGERSGWSLRWVAGAIAIVGCVASIDEFHQSFIPSRTGTWHDAVLDLGAAVLAQLLLRAARVLPFRPS